MYWRMDAWAHELAHGRMGAWAQSFGANRLFAIPPPPPTHHSSFIRATLARRRMSLVGITILRRRRRRKGAGMKGCSRMRLVPATSASVPMPQAAARLPVAAAVALPSRNPGQRHLSQNRQVRRRDAGRHQPRPQPTRPQPHCSRHVGRRYGGGVRRIACLQQQPWRPT
jgi:hypothetical protein